jgi:hypothetical protein
VFLYVRGFQYRIQFHAPRDQFDEQWKIARRVLDGFELIELDAEGQERVRLQALAARCGSQVRWAADWEEAARRGREEGRLVVVAVHAQPGFSVGNALNSGVFMSPEVLALMEHRFVGWRWSAGATAPFVDHDVFGLSPSTFGVGLLVCTPAGEVVRQVFIPEPLLVADALRAALVEHQALAPPPDPPAGTRAEQIAFLVDSGQLEAARRLLGEVDQDEPGAVSYQRARLHHLARGGGAALTALKMARRSTDRTAPEAATLLLEEATVRIGLGDDDIAEELLARCLASSPDSTTRSRALLFEGALSWAGGDRDATRAQWLALTHELPEEPAAWAAAAGLLGPALRIDMQPDLSWPSEAVERMAVIPPPAPASSTLDIASALSDAVGWLIDTQRPDGGWDIPYGAADTHPAPGPIPMASQAICTLALARAADRWQEPAPDRAARCRDAARRGLDRYLADRALVRERPRPVAFMDYTCWAASYGLFCLTSLHESLPGADRSVLESEATHLVDDLVRIQAGNGGWSYYVSGVVGGSSSGAAMSFTTATVLLALHAARERGVSVPEETLDRGIECLERMRGTNGVWEYMRQGTQMQPAGHVEPAGAAARGPVCTLAMVRRGRLGFDAMTPAFSTYTEHLAGFGAEARKALMHAGPAGQGSHYLLYDYSTAAEALRATDEASLDTGLRRSARAAILRELARCRSADGSFVDNPLLGCATGTGLATLTLLDLMGPPAASP